MSKGLQRIEFSLLCAQCLTNGMMMNGVSLTPPKILMLVNFVPLPADVSL
jgi:hypothetical protein